MVQNDFNFYMHHSCPPHKSCRICREGAIPVWNGWRYKEVNKTVYHHHHHHHYTGWVLNFSTERSVSDVSDYWMHWSPSRNWQMQIQYAFWNTEMTMEWVVFCVLFMILHSLHKDVLLTITGLVLKNILKGGWTWNLCIRHRIFTLHNLHADKRGIFVPRTC